MFCVGTFNIRTVNGSMSGGSQHVRWPAHQQAVVVQLRGGRQQLGGRLGSALLHQQLCQERRPLQ